MITPAYALKLTEEEAALQSRIECDALKLTGHEHAKINGELVLKLLRSLRSREAIPGHRWGWLIDPQQNFGGRGKSRWKAFERNNTSGNDIARHPHFLPYLHYFIFGPNLPPPVAGAFAAEVERCGNVTSGDVTPLGRFARSLTRSAGLERRDAADEFFKLALELRLSLMVAHAIRKQVLQA